MALRTAMGWTLFLLLSLLINSVALSQARQQQPPQRAATPPTRGALAPNWFPLPKPQQDHLDKVLRFWEYTTNKIERYRCKFKRWEYDFGQDPNTKQVKFLPKTYSTGEIKYAAPDKGLFRVETIQLARISRETGKLEWVEQKDGYREHWVCDGKSVFEFDSINKQLKQRPLPPEMQGQRIAEGPLPFLFGAKREQILERFWVRPLNPPPGVQDEHHLEAIPRQARDAANFRSLHIVIDANDFLPKAMVLFDRAGGKTTFVFEERETNWTILPELLAPWQRKFHVPQTPPGWQKVVEPLGQSATPRAAQQPQRQATPRR